MPSSGGRGGEPEDPEGIESGTISRTRYVTMGGKASRILLIQSSGRKAGKLGMRQLDLPVRMERRLSVMDDLAKQWWVEEERPAFERGVAAYIFTVVAASDDLSWIRCDGTRLTVSFDAGFIDRVEWRNPLATSRDRNAVRGVRRE